MFLGLGSVLLACLSFTGNIDTSGDYQFSNYNNFQLSSSVQNGVDYEIEFVNDYDTLDSGRMVFYLQYENSQYQYMTLTIGQDLVQNPTINYAFNVNYLPNSTEFDVFSFDVYLRCYQYEEDGTLAKTTLVTIREYNRYQVQFGSFLYTDYYRSVISMTFSPYDQATYNALTGYNPPDSYNDGYDKGYTDGYHQGYNDGEYSGDQSYYQDGWNDGYEVGESVGYQDGLTDGQNMDDQMNTIFANIFQVAMVPVNFFLGIFNFEIFGINISSFVTALLTIAVIIIIIKTIVGNTGGGSDGK